jgi:chromosome segregation ATPase
VGTQEIRALLEEKTNSDPPVYRHGSFGRELVRELMDAHDALARSYESAAAECSRLREERDTLNNEYSRLRHDLDMQRRLLANTSADIRKLHQYGDEQMGRADVLATEVHSLRSQVAAAEGEEGALREENARLRHDFDIQKMVLESSDREIHRLQERLLAEEGRVTHFSQELQRVKDDRLTTGGQGRSDCAVGQERSDCVEEFQAICQNLRPGDEERFVRGCYATWQLLLKRVELRKVAEVLGIRSEDLGV